MLRKSSHLLGVMVVPNSVVFSMQIGPSAVQRPRPVIFSSAKQVTQIKSSRKSDGMIMFVTKRK